MELELEYCPPAKPKGRRRHSKATFKNYQQDQLTFLPPSLEDLVPAGHMVRVISRTIDKLNLTHLIADYKGGGTSSYHPKMMLKVLVFAYTQKFYGSREIAKALRENVVFMWLSGNSRPSFSTINKFRSSRLKESIDTVFAEIVSLLHEEGFINFDNFFVDGTKIEANANKYSYVWRKSVQRYKKQLQEKVQNLLAHIDATNDAEQEKYGAKDLEELGESNTLTSEKLAATIKKLDENLANDTENKELKKIIKKLKKDAQPRLEKYEKQEEILDGRNSFSKIDHDATFMRMKDDHLNKGQLKASYNVQASTENQFIVNTSVHQNAADSTCMIEHFDKFRQHHGVNPDTAIGDAGYGSEENYVYLDQQVIHNIVKFPGYHREKKKSFKENKFHQENLSYNSEKDEFICPNGIPMVFVETGERETATGYKTEFKIYEAENCTDCALRQQCHKAEGNRRIQVNFNLRHFKEQARTNLSSEKGARLRKKRGVEVDAVFGHIKQSRGFRRFMLRGLEKVKIEINLNTMAANIDKLAPLAPRA